MAKLALIRQNKSEVLNEAQRYIERGWALVPFSSSSKNPYFELLPSNEDNTGTSWKPLATNKATIETVRTWLNHDPNTNIGVICGQASGIIIIDTDQPLKWPQEYITPTVKTNRGYHYYLQTDRPYKSLAITSKRNKHMGELRAEGNITIIPPSIHVETKRPYEWLINLNETPLQKASQNLLNALVELNPNLNSIELKEERRKIEARKNILSCSNAPKPFNLDTDSEVKSKIPYFEYLQDPRVAITIMNKIGVQVDRIGQAFSCPIHTPDDNPSAALYMPHAEGFVSMMDFHTRELIPLPDLYAAHIKGKYAPLRAGERAIWWIRCLVDLGYIDYPRILAKPLPDEAPEAAQILYSGFIRLLGIRKLYNANQSETPFSWRFAAGWCGLTNYKIQQGMAWLIANKFIHKVGVTTSRTSLFALQPVDQQPAPDTKPQERHRRVKGVQVDNSTPKVGKRLETPRKYHKDPLLL